MGAMSSVALGVPIPVNREGTRVGRRALLDRRPDLGQRDALPMWPLAAQRRAIFSACASSLSSPLLPILRSGFEHRFGGLVHPAFLVASQVVPYLWVRACCRPRFARDRRGLLLILCAIRRSGNERRGRPPAVGHAVRWRHRRCGLGRRRSTRRSGPFPARAFLEW